LILIIGVNEPVENHHQDSKNSIDKTIVMLDVFYNFAKNLKNFSELNGNCVSKADYQMVIGFLCLERILSTKSYMRKGTISVSILGIKIPH